MKRIKLLITLFFVPLLVINAQRSGGLCIADTLTTAHESAMLHIISTQKGLLLPTVTIAERDLIKPLTLGLTVFVKDPQFTGFQFWNGERWLSLEVITKKKASVIAPLGGIIMYHGRFDYFDEKGKGLPGTEMEGWQLCNGENGSPDLSGRFIVGGGRQTELADKDTLYKRIGEKRDINNDLIIAEANIPSHSHAVDKDAIINFSHTHDLFSQNTYRKGEKTTVDNGHLHQFYTKSSGSRKSGELSRKDARCGVFGSKSCDVDETILSKEIDLRNSTVSDATPVPRVEFNLTSSAIKESGLRTMPKFDNRPQYYVLAFIIRIDENIKETDGYTGPFNINY